MKKLCVLFLAVSICLSGCCVLIRPQEQIPDKPAPIESVPATQPAEQTEPTQQVQSGVPAYYPVKVEDQFAQVYPNPYNRAYSYCVHIPTVYWNGQENTSLREKIYADHVEKINMTGLMGQPVFDAAYSVGQADGIASVVTYFRCQDYEYSLYSVFNVDLSNGQEATDDQVLARFGYTKEQFYDEIRQITRSRFEDSFGDMEGFAGTQGYQEMLNRQVCDEIILAARPYVDEAGRLCAQLKLVVPAGAGEYPGSICLQSQDHIPTPDHIRCTQHN